MSFICLVVKSGFKENVPQTKVTDERKAMLLKWREQRELKRKAEAAKKQQKGVFAVRHVQHDNKTLLAPFPTEATKISTKKPKSVSVPPAKRVTRSSARLAKKQPAVKTEAKGRPASGRKETSNAKKPVTANKVGTKQISCPNHYSELSLSLSEIDTLGTSSSYDPSLEKLCTVKVSVWWGPPTLGSILDRCLSY